MKRFAERFEVAAVYLAVYLRAGSSRGAGYACVSRPWQRIDGHLALEDVPHLA